MKFTFTPTVEELTFLSVELSKSSGNFQRSCRRKQLVLGVAYALISFSFYMLGDHLSALFIVILGLLTVVFYPSLLKRGMHRGFTRFYQLPENKTLLSERAITITSKGVQLVKEGAKSEFSWKSVKKLMEYSHYYIVEFEAFQGVYLPKSLFKKGEEKEFKALFKKVPLEKIS